MTYFFGDVDAAAIVMKHCRGSGQGFSFEPLDEDPRPCPEYEYVKWGELNWNHVGHLGAGDCIVFESQEGFWSITLGALPNRGAYSDVEVLRNQSRMIDRERAKNIANMRAGD